MTSQELEFQVLRYAEQSNSQRSMANSIGYSVGKINYGLKALMEKGLIKAERFINSNNKVQYKYLLTEQGIKEKIALTEKYIEIKKREFDELQRELEKVNKENPFVGKAL